jgi:hypothetical protein
MSAWFDEYKCDRCGSIQSVMTANIVMRYVLPNQKEVSCDTRPAWCYRCKRLTEAEWIPSLEELLREREEALTMFWEKAGEVAADPAHVEEIRVELQERLDARIAWRRLRVSPARCMRCGNADVAYLVEESPGCLRAFEHPGCGGVFRECTQAIHCNTDRVLLFSTDGEPLNHKWRGWCSRLFSRWLGWLEGRFR